MYKIVRYKWEYGDWFDLEKKFLGLFWITVKCSCIEEDLIKYLKEKDIKKVSQYPKYFDNKGNKIQGK